MTAKYFVTLPPREVLKMMIDHCEFYDAIPFPYWRTVSIDALKNNKKIEFRSNKDDFFRYGAFIYVYIGDCADLPDVEPNFSFRFDAVSDLVIKYWREKNLNEILLK